MVWQSSREGEDRLGPACCLFLLSQAWIGPEQCGSGIGTINVIFFSPSEQFCEGNKFLLLKESKTQSENIPKTYPKHPARGGGGAAWPPEAINVCFEADDLSTNEGYGGL